MTLWERGSMVNVDLAIFGESCPDASLVSDTTLFRIAHERGYFFGPSVRRVFFFRGPTGSLDTPAIINSMHTSPAKAGLYHLTQHFRPSSPNLKYVIRILCTKNPGEGVGTMRAKHLIQLISTVALTLSAHPQTNIFPVNKYGAKPDGTTLNTAAIQRAIDAAQPTGGMVVVSPGTYLSGSLFLKSGITFVVEEGATIIGSQRLEDYPMLPTRIAGIEMTWPAALINTRDQHDITITGKGTIDGDGPIWWKSYWDLRAAYEPKGLRWASDYDAKRPRLMLLQNSSNIHLGGGITLKRSGFWTVQVLYSHDVTIDGVIIRNNEGGKGPSTDGIDIDSSRNVDVSHADIDVNDDALCLKAGRDSDGLRVNRPTEDIRIHDSIIHHGAAAITIGSETSGGFRNIEAWNITAESGVPNGVLFKSAHTRGGTARDIRIHDLTLIGVATPVSITMNWNPSYSYATLPAGTDSKTVPPYWIPLTTPVPDDKGLPHFSDVHIWNIKATGAKKAFNVSAYPNAPLVNFTIDHLDIQAATAGTIADAKDWKLSNNTIHTTDGSTVQFIKSGEIPAPEPTAFGDRPAKQ
jgi:hypothetical protein